MAEAEIIFAIVDNRAKVDDIAEQGCRRPPAAVGDDQVGLQLGPAADRLVGGLAEFEEPPVDLRPGGRRALPVLGRERVAPDVERPEHLGRGGRAVRDRLDQEVALPPGPSLGPLEGDVAKLGRERVVEEQHAHEGQPPRPASWLS